MLKKTIFTGFAPNLHTDDVKIACRFLFLPWYWTKWRRGDAVKKAETWLSGYYKTPVITFDSGRSSLFFALKTLGVKTGDDVIVQAFTCVVVINAIRALGAHPIYVDIVDDFNMSTVDLEKKITSKSHIIIIQHTFGTPAAMDELMTIAKKRNLKVVEDCAHAIGATYRGKLLGTFGELAIISFGTDKMVSCVRGGGVIVNDLNYKNTIRIEQEKLPQTPRRLLWQHLMHYPVFYIGKATYHLGVGKAILWFAQKLHITNKIIYSEEKRGEPMVHFPTQPSNALASILLLQLSKMNTILTHRRKIAQSYERSIHNPHILLPLRLTNRNVNLSDGSYVRYPILVEHPYNLFLHTKKQGILLGNWYDSVVSPCHNGCPWSEYVPGSCPRAETLTKEVVNLPTDLVIGDQEVKRIIKSLMSYD